MFVRKAMVGLLLAGLAGGALAQNSNSKTDIFGRPYTNLNGTELYYQSEPFDPLPQFAQRHSQEAAAPAQAATGKTDIFGRPYVGQTSLQVYEQGDAFGPLPQLWGHDVQGVGAVARNPGVENASAAGKGGNS